MLPYKYYLNTVTCTVSKHTATVLSCYHINITFNTVTRTVSKHTATVLSCYHINITFNTITRTVSKHTSTVLSCYHINITFNTVTCMVSKHTPTFPSYYHINIILTQLHVSSQSAPTHPVFSHCAVTWHTEVTINWYYSLPPPSPHYIALMTGDW